MFTKLFLQLSFIYQLISVSTQYGNYYRHYTPKPKISFVPAASGQTPTCATKNKDTFCEKIDNYPEEKIKELLKNFRSEDFLVDEVQTDINFEKHQEHEKNWYFPGEYKSYQNRRNTQSEKFHPIYYDGWKSNLKRVKRQSLGANEENLCSSRVSYINPQAALNSRGDWMFLVNNVGESTQLVRSETCNQNQTSCSTCQLPNRYTSRCEQRYAQKRLVALNSDGEKFYTDTFWFPSCCVCVLTVN